MGTVLLLQDEQFWRLTAQSCECTQAWEITPKSVHAFSVAQ